MQALGQTSHPGSLFSLKHTPPLGAAMKEVMKTHGGRAFLNIFNGSPLHWVTVCQAVEEEENGYSPKAPCSQFELGNWRSCEV